MSRDRAWRRQQREKRYRYVRPILEEWWCWDKRNDVYSFWSHSARNTTEEDFHIHVRRHQDNIPICSCSGCGNQRRNKWNNHRDRLTMAERRAEDSAQSQLDEIDAPRWPEPGTPGDIWYDEQEDLNYLSDYNLDPDWFDRIVLGIDASNN